MDPSDRVAFFWQGAAHYHILYKNVRIVIDPLYTRLPDDKPHLEAAKKDLKRVDYLLLTHGHLDHSWDFPYLASKHNPETFAPAECMRDIKKEETGSALDFDWARCHSLEDIKGTPFDVAGIAVTPYQIGTEEIDFWFIREMFLRPWRHRRPGTIPAGLKWLTHHLRGNCFAFHFRFPAGGKTLLYFGNLTDQVDELGEVEQVNVLGLPYCPANNKWLVQSQHLIRRFKPDVALIYHFDNFMNPYTLSKYMNLEDYRRAILEKCPGTKFYFSKFCEEVAFSEIAGSGKRVMKGGHGEK